MILEKSDIDSRCASLFMEEKMYKKINTNGKNEDFKKLCILLDDNLNEIVGGEKMRYSTINTMS